MPDLKNQSTARLLLTAARITEYRHNELLRRLNLTHSGLTVLSALHSHGPLSQVELARYLRIEPQTLGATLRRLSADGLIIRASKRTDRRIIEVLLSQAGAEALLHAKELDALLPEQDGMRESLAALIKLYTAMRWNVHARR